MDQAIIFCRTKIDCDNLEQYFMQQGGGPDKKDTSSHVFVFMVTENLMRESKTWKDLRKEM